MQAIRSYVIPATNTKPTRIKAICARGSIITSAFSTDESGHHNAVATLMEKFIREDNKKYGTPTAQNSWGNALTCGQLPDGSYAHVFINK